MKNLEHIQAESHYLAGHYHPLPVVIKQGKAEWLYDIEGNQYLDMMSAYSAVSHGHCHPELVKTLRKQAKKLCVTSRACYTENLLPLAKKLTELAGLPKVLFMNSGAEAVETAIKAARKWGYEKKGITSGHAEIIVAQGNFHGRTSGIISCSSEPLYRKHFEPLMPGFKIIPYGDALALRNAINKNTCAFLVEPIQGEAGIIVPPEGYLKAIRQICTDQNVLLMADEVQTGLCRTGKWFAFQHEAIQVDGLILGKALGGGMLPISAFLAQEEVMSVFTPGTHGSTMGGNPLAAAVAYKALAILESENLAQQACEKGAYLLKGLQKIHSPLIKGLRGKGLLIGIEIDTQLHSARAICEKLLANGLLTKETHDTVIRLAPPLVIKYKNIDFALQILARTLKELL